MNSFLSSSLRAVDAISPSLSLLTFVLSLSLSLEGERTTYITRCPGSRAYVASYTIPHIYELPPMSYRIHAHSIWMNRERTERRRVYIRLLRTSLLEATRHAAAVCVCACYPNALSSFLQSPLLAGVFLLLFFYSKRTGYLCVVTVHDRATLEIVGEGLSLITSLLLPHARAPPLSSYNWRAHRPRRGAAAPSLTTTTQHTGEC